MARPQHFHVHEYTTSARTNSPDYNIGIPPPTLYIPAFRLYSVNRFPAQQISPNAPLQFILQSELVAFPLTLASELPIQHSRLYPIPAHVCLLCSACARHASMLMPSLASTLISACSRLRRGRASSRCCWRLRARRARGPRWLRCGSLGRRSWKRLGLRLGLSKCWSLWWLRVELG